jgi:hypothetical protein
MRQVSKEHCQLLIIVATGSGKKDMQLAKKRGYARREYKEIVRALELDERQVHDVEKMTAGGCGECKRRKRTGL